jgi:hypothetical protein
MKNSKFLIIVILSLLFISWVAVDKKQNAKKNTVQVLSFYKVVDPKSSSGIVDMKVYNSWNLTKENIVTILQSSHPVNGTTLDFDYEVLPYWYKGEMIMNGVKSSFDINAASFVEIIFKNDSIQYLGCTLKSNYKYFLSHPNLK